METARVKHGDIIQVLQITTPTRKYMQDVTLQVLHHQEKISVVIIARGGCQYSQLLCRE